MSRWLKVAEGLFRGRVSDPSPFEIHCACGRTVTGFRTTTAQTQTCPVCQTRLFVLPDCVYPQPRGVKRKILIVPPKAEAAEISESIEAESIEPGTVEFDAAESELDDSEASPLAEPSKTIRTPAGPKRKSDAAPSKPRTAQPAPARDDTDRGDTDRARLERLRRKLLSPVRLVLAGVALVVVMTIGWIWHLSSLGQAERTVVSATKLAELALDEHDLGEAARQYRQVKRALDVLGRNDSRARALRQTAAELSAAADLARVSLFDILHEASSMAAGAARDSWAETFHSNYRDEWVVLDARVSRVVHSAEGETADGRRYDIEFRLAEGPNRAIIIADLPAFESAISPGGEPLRVIFAAQLDDCSVDPHHANTWRIVLRPATGFLWSSAKHLELLGVTADDETKVLLAEQTARLGIAP